MVILLSEGAAADAAARARFAGEINALHIDTVLARGGHGQDTGRLARKYRSGDDAPVAPDDRFVAPWAALAYDGSPEADRASVTAVHLASRTGAVLRFVTVAPTPEDEPAARAMAHKGGATAPLDIDALADVVVGPVARVLADLPERTDILVIGSRGYRFMRRLLLGGVAGALVRSARYPVVIVPSLG